jgi:hypothetical protein
MGIEIEGDVGGMKGMAFSWRSPRPFFATSAIEGVYEVLSAEFAEKGAGRSRRKRN